MIVTNFMSIEKDGLEHFAGEIVKRDPKEDDLEREVREKGVNLTLGDVVCSPDGRRWSVEGFRRRPPFIDIVFKGLNGTVDFDGTTGTISSAFEHNLLKKENL